MPFFKAFFLLPLSLTLGEDVFNPQISKSEDNAIFTKVVSMDFCYSCLEERDKGYKASHKDLPAFAELENDDRATFGPNFTICVSVTNPSGFQQALFSVQFINIICYLKLHGI